jgi:hypothetical protein
MPTVLRFEGMRMVIYPNDHQPGHVHMIGRGREAVFILNCPDGPVETRENYRFAKRELRHILLVVTENLETLCEAWEEIHGIA